MTRKLGSRRRGMRASNQAVTRKRDPEASVEPVASWGRRTSSSSSLRESKFKLVAPFMAQEDVKFKFLKASILCKAVVCCRVTPAQKAEVRSRRRRRRGGQKCQIRWVKAGR